ncbi:ATP-binding protein, partial [Methylicorpusculum sp.]|uniref:ATP-binding protein n=1 Tax=Methylicorpusculum sp. TaxID=2713644 RepID=UPI002ABCF471
KNRLLLHGAPGNGKTTMARAIAKESKCHSIYVNGPEFMDEHIGQGAKNIKRTFNSAQEHADLHKENVVIIIDEIDAFAGNVDSPERSEHKATLQELWHQLDLIQDDPRIFFVGMTNAEEIDGALKSRFGNNIIKLESPDAKMRKAVLQFYKTKHTGKPWDNTLLQKLVDRSKFQTISIRFLQDYTEEVIQIAKNQTENVITQELAFKVFDEMKAKYVQGWIPYLWNGTCKYSLKTLNAAAALRILWPVPIPVPTPVPVPA